MVILLCLAGLVTPASAGPQPNGKPSLWRKLTGWTHRSKPSVKHTRSVSKQKGWRTYQPNSRQMKNQQWRSPYNRMAPTKQKRVTHKASPWRETRSRAQKSETRKNKAFHPTKRHKTVSGTGTVHGSSAER